MDPLIVQVIHRYHPAWDAPVDNGYEWISTLCPFHDDSNRSASVSFVRNAFHCFACPAKGDAISLLRQHEGLTFEAAKRLTEELSPGSYREVSRKPQRKSRRRVFEVEGSGVPQHGGSGEQVPTGLRQRPSSWA